MFINIYCVSSAELDFLQELLVVSLLCRPAVAGEISWSTLQGPPDWHYLLEAWGPVTLTHAVSHVFHES